MDGLLKWQKTRRTFIFFLLVGALGSGAVAYRIWGIHGFLAAESVELCLALGLWITERLIGVFTSLRPANPTNIALLFLGKLGWWAAIILGAKHLPPGLDGAVGLGIGTFLLALFASTFCHYGKFRASNEIPPQNPYS